MTVTARIQKITDGLSPRQRAAMVVKALREGREPDPGIRDIKDPQERRAFNRYIALLWVANHQLGVVSAITAARVEVAQKEAWRAGVLDEAAGLLDEAEGNPPSRGQRNWRKRTGQIEVSVFLRSLALEWRDDAAALVTQLWLEAISLNQVWRDLGDEFGGEDLVLPDHRERMVAVEAALQDLARSLAIKKLPSEPNEEMIQGWTRQANDALRQLGWAEPF